MKLRRSIAILTVVLISLVSVGYAAHERKKSVDVGFGYSRVGANLYGPYTSGMNGWDLAMHVKPIPFFGVEGDVSRYSHSESNYSQQVLLVMGGPRVTVHAAGFSVFAHALGGLAHHTGTLTIYPSNSYNAASYALGAGADLPLILGLKARVTGDYLGNSKAPDSSYSPAHYRFGLGVAYHF